MSTKQIKIERVKARIATHEAKLANLSIVKKLQQKKQAEEAELAKLEAEERKAKANRRRIDDKRAKVLLGVAVLQMPVPRRSRTISESITALNERDHRWLENWCIKSDLDLMHVDSKPPLMLMAPGSTAFDVVGDVLKRVIGGMSEGTIGLFAPEVLDAANEVDRAILEAWFASLTCK